MCAVALLQCSRLWFGRSPKRCCFALIKRLSKFELRNNRNHGQNRRQMCAVALLQCSRLWFGRSPKRCCVALIKRLSKFELRNNRNSQLLWVFVPCCHCIRAFVASTNQRKGTNSVKRAAVAARALCRTQSNVLAETTPFHHNRLHGHQLPEGANRDK